MEKFTFFYRSASPFSQWYGDAPFTKFGITFKTAEHFMMWRKGVTFGAGEILLTAIINAVHPRDAKALGRSIPNFNEKIWDAVCKPLVLEGNFAKFTQNNIICHTLMNTRGTTLVEASPSDRIWGIGLAEDDPRALSRTTWQGKNYLGDVLTELRTNLEIVLAFGNMG